MREVAEVKKPGQYDVTTSATTANNPLNIPRHLSPMNLNHSHHYRYQAINAKGQNKNAIEFFPLI